MADFSSLGLSDWLVQQCKQLGINKPTPVQENCMPAILRGKTAPVKASVKKHVTRLSASNFNIFVFTVVQLNHVSQVK